LRVEIDVRQAFVRYELTAKRLADYKDGVLTDVGEVLNLKREAYRGGKIMLLDVIEAYRTAEEVYAEYFEALSDAAKAWVQLQTAVGIWETAF
jgi:outer membrane protein, heavy metal efflux system